MRKRIPQPSKERLHELFSYKDGNLFAKLRRPHRAIGQLLGYRNTAGYLMVEVDRDSHRVHRLIWIMHFGSIPDHMVIDHIDRTRQNNRIENLRCVTQTANARNREPDYRNVGGYYGVAYDVRRQKWTAKLPVFLGEFRTVEEAVHARKDAEALIVPMVDSLKAKWRDQHANRFCLDQEHGHPRTSGGISRTEAEAA